MADPELPDRPDPREAKYVRDKLLHSAVVIGDCVQERVSLLVLNLESRAVSGGSFFKVARDHLVAKISPRADPSLFRPLTPCSVSFTLGARAHVFVTTVREIRPPAAEGSRPRLLLNMPGEIAALECRHSFRVPILPDSSLQIRVIEPQPSGEARGIDISVHGLQFELEMEAARRLAVDQRINLELVYQDTTITARAIVRRRSRNRIGVMLVDAKRPGVPLQDPAIEQLVRSLEREWLRNRLTDEA
ncbi:MAG: PilZ domain-containing protein [Nannocystaceae bacterium]